MTPAIETRGLTKRYRRVTALSECDITVPEGRISALVGPNGAGKTTLLRLLSGLARPTSGEAEIRGRRLRQDPAFLAEIGFLAQEIPLYRRLSAADHIGIGAANRAGTVIRSGTWAAAWLNIRWTPPARCPGQRGAPGRARAHAGQAAVVLLLDEPVAALDPLARRHFFAILADAVAEADCCAVLAPRRGHRAGLRPPDPRPLPASSSAGTSRACSPSTGCSSARARRWPMVIERDHAVVQTERTAR